MRTMPIRTPTTNVIAPAEADVGRLMTDEEARVRVLVTACKYRYASQMGQRVC